MGASHSYASGGKKMLRKQQSGQLPGQQTAALSGYSAAVLGVLLTSFCIGLIRAFAQVENLSVAYLLVVLWLAVSFGRGPALLAAFLSFLAYDFFFVPPATRLTVEDPTQWISLLALLATALVIGHLTASVQAHAAAALASQQRTAHLYALAQSIASTTDQVALFRSLAQQTVQIFAARGVAACALVLPDAENQPRTQAVAPLESLAAAALRLQGNEQEVVARRVLQQGAAVCFTEWGERTVQQEEYVRYYVPLSSGCRVVGALGLAGAPGLHSLVAQFASAVPGKALRTGNKPADLEAEFFAAFCGQMGLALEQVALRQEAIHAEALRESDRLKNVLLDSVTHDLRTPLASIKAATSSLLEPEMTWREEDRREFLDGIDASVERLNHLVGNLLDLSRLEAGAAMPQRKWYLIGDVIAPVLAQLEQAGQFRDRQIEVELPDTLPLVLLDHGQIERVLANLLENALKYSPPESVIRVQARVVGAPLELEVRVSDQGIGIPPHELQAIFHKFYRGQHEHVPWAPTRPVAGTGLGLAICANILRAHQGRIWAESSPGAGTTIAFTLPIPPDSPEGELPELDAPAQEAAAGVNIS
jgi:two-component system sensor histidine kinase KdpD